MTVPTDLVVPTRFRGPASSGNGGWSAGALAALLPHGDDRDDDRCVSWPAITVTLRQPPPLDVPMPVAEDAGDQGGTLVASYDGRPVAQARLTERDLEPVSPVGPDEARAAEASYPGLVSHPFPTCFACGTGREEGDGLRIFPGAVAPEGGAVRTAATWTPHPSLAEDWHEYRDDVRHASLPVTWAALDCVGGWAGDLTERLMVLGTMTARIDTLPVIGEEHVVMGTAR
ncbi:MAG: hypothetical protein Q8O61_14790, partial [Nocardioides sp.]|nr:hypothetical protein [Nocardioides sp.]